MKRFSFAISLLVFLTLACSLAGSLPTQTPTQPEKPCGDGVCDGPENGDNCPEDCPAPTQATLSTGMPPLFVGLSVHLEGYDLGNSQIGYNQELYQRYSQSILEYSDLANEYGLPITWETANLISPSGALEPNILLELYQRGDGVGIHADLGGKMSAGEVGKLTIGLRQLRQEMASLGVPVSHVSGVCSAADWVSASLDAGFEAVTGVVEYCLKALPLDEQPSNVQACTSPAECQDPYPGAIPELLHPWQAQTGSIWTTPADEGLLIVPTAGEIKCMHESLIEPGSYTHCEMTSEDVDAVLKVIADALAVRDPSQVNQVFFVWSFGSAIDHDILRSLFAGIKTHVDAGEVVWQTLPELIQTYQAQR